MKMRIISLLMLLSLVFPAVACEKHRSESVTPPESGFEQIYNIPIDFSNVGYHSGEKPIPMYKDIIILEAPSDGSDATALIQNALDNVSTPGAVLLKAGTYNIATSLNIGRSGVVLRGEGPQTVIKATGTSQRTLIKLGKSTKRSLSRQVTIVDDLVPVGQKWVTVSNPGAFQPGERVCLYFKPNQQWISDLKMDEIAQNSDNSVKQWTVGDYILTWERVVEKVEGDKVWLDAPVVMELHAEYASQKYLYHSEWDRIEESGIENLKLDTEYDVQNPNDEEHSWNAIDVVAAENCWIRNAESAHFAMSMVDLKKGAIHITVRNCVSTEPVSVITGGRRYAFHISGGELSLVENCRAEHDRHGFVTGARVCGPNVFRDCVMTDAYSTMGPHHRWASGLLYDCCSTDANIEVQDRAGYGTGHGWAGVSVVFWNCEGKSLVCQNPWVNGKNWSVGYVGTKWKGRKYSDGMTRPDGEWYSYGKHVEPESLYKYQMANRVPSASYDVYLLIGQSNKAGRGLMVEGDEAVIDENVFILDDKGDVVPARNPLNQYSSIRKDISMQQIGPGFSFVKKIAEKTGRKILLVVNARGGSNLNEWIKGAEKGYYEEAVRRTKQALKHGQLKGILWHQGESNSRDTDYLEKLSGMVSGLRSELDAEKVPFIAGELAYWRSSSPVFNEMIKNISKVIENSSYVTADGCTMLKDEKDPHFSRDGQILLGERYADMLLKMLE